VSAVLAEEGKPTTASLALPTTKKAAEKPIAYAWYELKGRQIEIQSYVRSDRRRVIHFETSGGESLKGTEANLQEIFDV